jgi:hypothetical protein
MLPHENIFGSMQEILDYLKHINNLRDTDSLDRWLFFKDII